MGSSGSGLPLGLGEEDRDLPNLLTAFSPSHSPDTLLLSCFKGCIKIPGPTESGVAEGMKSSLAALFPE